MKVVSEVRVLETKPSSPIPLLPSRLPASSITCSHSWSFSTSSTRKAVGPSPGKESVLSSRRLSGSRGPSAAWRPRTFTWYATSPISFPGAYIGSCGGVGGRLASQCIPFSL